MKPFIFVVTMEKFISALGRRENSVILYAVIGLVILLVFVLFNKNDDSKTKNEDETSLRP